MSSAAVVIGALRVNHYSQYGAYLESAYTSFKCYHHGKGKKKKMKMAELLPLKVWSATS